MLSGKGVFGAIAMGKLSYYERKNFQVKKYLVGNVRKEIIRYQKAKETSLEQLRELYNLALQEVEPETAMIFEAHQLMLEDLDFNEYITNRISAEAVNAEYAVERACGNFFRIFSEMDDPYMQERAADIRDVSDRLLRALANYLGNSCTVSEPSIVAAEDLVPSETVQLDREKVLAFVTERGSETSHTAILAKDMNIPAVIGLGKQLKREYSGMNAIVDGFEGKVYIEPDEETISLLMDKKRCEEEKRSEFRWMKGKANVTLDGHKIDLYANIANPDDVDKVLENDAGGIGLMRSEFLYLDGRTFPSEERQFRAYKNVVQKMGEKTVIIRTMDVGADKQADYFGLPKEENPAMGYRAIRICLEQPDIFKTQLRAIYRASAFGKVAIMFPMITSVEEVGRIWEIADEVRRELSAEKIPFNRKVKMGIMIETPAAALISDILAEMVDFFSIGTNDLVQYTLAVDRQNAKLEWYHNTHHLAILRLISLVTDNAHQNGIKVGICGELAADFGLTTEFLKMGIDELSMPPSMILPMRKRIREIDLSVEPVNQQRS